MADESRGRSLIGRKLSQKYRFAEGAAYQRQALAFDADYLPGQDAARRRTCCGWARKTKAGGWPTRCSKQDGYNVVAYNLVTLHEELAKFRTLERRRLRRAHGAREADLYGDRVLELLQRARTTLCEKYDVKLDEPIIVEIFPQQKDFAVRTFGLPGGERVPGRLLRPRDHGQQPGVAGRAARRTGRRCLWHEFCHVVTLNKTHNKMPRWLSEGISVYEERQADPTWGQSMNPQYREMILSGETDAGEPAELGVPRAAKSPLHLQFAYYESSLVVEYLVEQYGLRRAASRF